MHRSLRFIAPFFGAMLILIGILYVAWRFNVLGEPAGGGATLLSPVTQPLWE